MAHQIKSYHVLFYGSPAGYHSCRAQLALYGRDSKVKAYIRFHDPGQLFPDDSEEHGRIIMNLPTSNFSDIIDVLRNEDGIKIYLIGTRAFLGTDEEPVGEGED